MTGTEPSDVGNGVMAEDGAARVESAEPAADTTSEQILALLARIGEPADAHSAPELSVQVEFGIESLQDMIADSGMSTPDELVALVALGEAGGVDVPGRAPAPATASADVGSSFGGVDQLAIKIIFGYDEENGTTTT